VSKQEIYVAIVSAMTTGSRPILMLKTLCPDTFSDFSESGIENSSQGLYDYLNPVSKKICGCGNALGFDSFAYGYKKFCSIRCHSRIENMVAKRRDTWKAKYGVENPSQDPKAFQRNMRAKFKMKDVRLFGVDFTLQGYEPQAVSYLVNEFGAQPEKLSTPSVSVPYEYGNKKRRYIPDFVCGRLIVEVKSPYTCGLKGNITAYETTLAKLSGAIKAGYDALLLVMNKDGSLNSASYNGCDLVASLPREAICKIKAHFI
jgi:hypothetical protein